MPLVKAKLTEDKTLWVKVGNVEQIGRVIIEDGSTFCKVFYADSAIEQDPVIDKIRAEIIAKIENEDIARSVILHEEKDEFQAQQCTGSIWAYKDVIRLIDKYKADMREEESNAHEK